MAKKAEQVNSEFEMLGLGDVTEELDSPEPGIDPEDDRANWPTIMINTEDGKPNYETVIVHGTKKDGTPVGHDLQIMRGVPVKVPPSVVNALKEAVATHTVASKDRDGQLVLIRQDRP